MGKDGRMKKVRRKVQVDSHGTPLARKVDIQIVASELNSVLPCCHVSAFVKCDCVMVCLWVHVDTGSGMALCLPRHSAGALMMPIHSVCTLVCICRGHFVVRLWLWLVPCSIGRHILASLPGVVVPERHTQICLASPSVLRSAFCPTCHTGISLQTKPSKDGADAKSPKPARRQANAAATYTAAAAPPQAMPLSPDPGRRLPPWETSKPPSPQSAAPHSLAAAAPQPGPTPEEDRTSLAALAARVTPAQAPRVGCSYTISDQKTPG